MVSAYSQATPAPAEPAETPPAATKPASATALSDKALADTLKLLKDLSSKLGAAKSKSSAAALAAFQAALASDDKAYSLYMDCVKKVEFDDKGKDGPEFGEWKRRDDVKALHEPEHKQVLKLQLQWLVMSIQAGNAVTDAEFAKVVSQVPAFLDSLAEAWKRMKTFRGKLNADVIGTVFGKFFKLDITLQRRDGWSYNPMSIDSIYDTVVLPYLRNLKKASEVTNSWKKRIQMLTDVLEIEQREAKQGKDDPNSKAEENLIRFKEEKLPRLEWGMLKDGYLMGNEVGAAPGMVSHISKYLGHKDAALWIEELTKLLNHEDVAPTLVSDSTNGESQNGGGGGGRQQGPQRRR